MWRWRIDTPRLQDGFTDLRFYYHSIIFYKGLGCEVFSVTLRTVHTEKAKGLSVLSHRSLHQVARQWIAGLGMS